ncbi:hypothetical protein T4D_6612 [Trichinella pseudospiralis]|uniref:Uncharacterized protein n=1 Tax=Trichinella pseudospiralis TaxID=6337 RepID=A0A0V1FE62_TRIPS|nr:hypothetical protein T4D_6612 [Trichinella pseudospiralis]
MHAKEAVIRSVIAGLSAILASKIAKIEGYCPRGHCRYTVYDMLTKKEEEYSIFMSERDRWPIGDTGFKVLSNIYISKVKKDVIGRR